MPRNKTIRIEVSQGILYIGGDAYPLHNIARVQNIELVPRRRRAVTSFIKGMLLWAVLGVGGIVGMDYVDLPASDVETITGYIAIAATALAVLSTVKLLVLLARRSYYALVIETAGTPHTALISPNEGELDQLVRQIMAAISNPRDPRVEFRTQIVHHHNNSYFGGQHVNMQGGSNNVGIRN